MSELLPTGQRMNTTIRNGLDESTGDKLKKPYRQRNNFVIFMCEDFRLVEAIRSCIQLTVSRQSNAPVQVDLNFNDNFLIGIHRKRVACAVCIGAGHEQNNRRSSTRMRQRYRWYLNAKERTL